MAKKHKILFVMLLACALIVPAVSVYANTVQVTVNIAAFAEIASVESQTSDLGGREYTITVRTNSSKGYDLYASADGKNWENVRSFNGFPRGEDLKSTVKTTNASSLEFKVAPRE